MRRNIMVVITGAPATGKTTLSNQLANKFNLPKINKDEIKERLFENLQVENKEWSIQLGIASFELTYLFVEKLAQTGKMFIVEGNFDNKYASRIFDAIRIKYNYKVIQLYCHVSENILYDRFIERNLSGNRHPGHIRKLNGFEDFKNKIVNKDFKLDIEESINIDIDTTNFNNIDYDEVFNVISIEKSI